MSAWLMLADAAAFGIVFATVVRRHFQRAAAVPPPVRALFIDCDDCLYQNDWATAKKITTSIDNYTARLGISKEEAYNLYKTHGTCLKGLLVEGRIDAAGVEDFLHEVHQISYVRSAVLEPRAAPSLTFGGRAVGGQSDIGPDPAMAAVLTAVTRPADNMWVS